MIKLIKKFLNKDRLENEIREIESVVEESERIKNDFMEQLKLNKELLEGLM